jgi:hypothetical protein
MHCHYDRRFQQVSLEMDRSSVEMSKHTVEFNSTEANWIQSTCIAYFIQQ